MEIHQETYDTVPGYDVPRGQLAAGYAALAEQLLFADAPIWLIDGMSGVDWPALHSGLQTALGHRSVEWIDVAVARKETAAIKQLLAPYLDNRDQVFGKLYDGNLIEFFDEQGLEQLRERMQQAVARGQQVICFGQGSALLNIDRRVAWIDLPKEIITQQVSSGRNILLGTPSYPGMKSIYWVDWPVMERHKTSLLGKLDLFVDLTEPVQPVFASGDDVRTALQVLAHQPFRVKPVFYPGAWGGQWMKQHMQLDPAQPNYAWSYELITPENGIVLCDGELRLEIPFEMLMAQETINIQGQPVADRFGASFPIRFNYDDTLEGGNLSCQVHPQLQYARQEFGLTYAQDETYYILRAGQGGLCYLGLKQGIDPQAFRRAAEGARDEGVGFDTEGFVNAWPTRVHDLFLIPAGTVHNSGANNVVLEISATPYLYTFKIYDYLRRDLKGNLRPIHIERAWENIDFNRQTHWVRQNLIPSPRIIRTGPGWTEYVIGTHPLMFFAIHRAEFARSYPDDTQHQRFHVLNLVEGDQISIEWAGGRHPLRYAETIVIPAAVGHYTLHHDSAGVAKVVKAFVRDLD
ncbi:MAG TPA: class I mannose-6-phosphate isomerase [Anaerolineae bacterium]|nr:class I mannose-6-phosphate isomerase [Anaerolineae bacterium]